VWVIQLMYESPTIITCVGLLTQRGRSVGVADGAVSSCA
jgi:hypothetical protein